MRALSARANLYGLGATRWRSSPEGFQWHGVKRGAAFAFYAGDIRVEGPHPFSSSGGNLGNGRTRTAMYTDSIEQLRGTAGARQVKVRAETALAAFTTPSNGGWDHVLTLEITARRDQSQSLTQNGWQARAKVGNCAESSH